MRTSQGVVVTDLADGGTAASVGFQKGDIILAVNNQKIAKTSDLEKATRESVRLWRITAGARRPADQRHARRMSPKRPREAASLFAAAGMEQDAPHPLAGQAAPAHAVGCRRTGSHSGARRRADAHAGDAHAGLADLLGAAGHRQDHGGAAAGGCHRTAFRADFGGVFRRRRSEEGVRCGARAARDGQGHAAVRRRGASLQSRAAGFVSARDGRRHRGAGRRDHRKSVVRTQRRAAVAGARAGVSFARCRPRSKSCSPMPRRSRAGSCRSMPRPAPCWCGWPTATAAPR